MHNRYCIYVSHHDYMQAVKNHFACFAKWDTSLKVGFQKSEIILNIPDDGELTQEGWKITPMTYPAVSLHVLLYTCVDDYLPFCMSLVHVDCQEGSR